MNRRGQVTRLTSKHLGKRWTSEVKVSGGDVLGVVGNDVSYGPFVQSAEHQAWHHGLRGWKTDEQVLEEEAAWVQREFAGAIRTALGD